MQNMDWNDLNYCLVVANEGSVSAAAKKLGVNHTTVSRRVTALEKELGATLFDRSTKGWLITPLGESILPSLQQMQEEANTVLRHATAGQEELSGKLRVTAVDICIQRVLLPGLKAFSEKYPDISIELIASDESFNLAAHDADIAFRTTDNPPPNVVGKKIADFAHALYGTEELYQRVMAGDPTVGAVTWMGDGTSQPEWIAKDFPDMPIRYRANSLNVSYDLITNGHGIGQLPCGLGDAEHGLRRIPCKHVDAGMGFWVLSHIDLRTTARIRIFRDFMLDSIAPYVPLIEGRMSQEEIRVLERELGL